MTTKTVTNQNKIKKLLISREKIIKRLKKIDKIFQEEKENEEFWPGHASNRFQAADNEGLLLQRQLSLIESELEKLGCKQQNKS